MADPRISSRPPASPTHHRAAVISDTPIKAVHVEHWRARTRGEVIEAWIRSGLWARLSGVGKAIGATLIALGEETNGGYLLVELPDDVTLRELAGVGVRGPYGGKRELELAGVIRPSARLAGRFIEVWPATPTAQDDAQGELFEPASPDDDPRASADSGPQPTSDPRASADMTNRTGLSGPRWRADEQDARDHDPRASADNEYEFYAQPARQRGSGGDFGGESALARGSSARFGGVRGGSALSGEEEKKAAAAAAAAEKTLAAQSAEDARRRELALLGIAPPARDELARLDVLTVEDIRRVGERWRQRAGKGVGVLIADLRAEAERLTLQAERRAERQQRAEAQRREQEATQQAEHARTTRIEAELDAMLTGLSVGELHELRERAMNITRMKSTRERLEAWRPELGIDQAGLPVRVALTRALQEATR